MVSGCAGAISNRSASRLRCTSLGWPGYPPSSGAGGASTVMVTTVPPPRLSSTSSMPPSAATRPEASASPDPAPRTMARICSSAVVYPGSMARRGSEMPGPRSDTLTVRPASSTVISASRKSAWMRFSMTSRSARGGTDEIWATWEKVDSMSAACAMSRISVMAGGSRAARCTATRTTYVLPWRFEPVMVSGRSMPMRRRTLPTGNGRIPGVSPLWMKEGRLCGKNVAAEQDLPRHLTR
jgi:hypothetical protein